MIDTKQIAKDILEDYANCYSQVDLETLAKYLDKIKAEARKEFAAKLYNCFKEYETYDKHYTFEILDKIESVEAFLDNLLIEMESE